MKILVLILVCASLATSDNLAVQDFTNANNLFAQGVYEKLAKIENDNFLVSPFSAETVLSFLLSGSKGQTADEIRTALHLSNDKDKIESALKSLLPKFKDNGQYTLHTANKLYIKENFNLKNEFKTAANLVYQTDVETIDFERNAESAKIMNAWVEKHTNSKIKNLVDFKILNNFTRSVLINALYFKANWTVPFLLSSTSKRDFYKSESEVVHVDTLHQHEEYFDYYECPHLEAQFLELPFQGGEASLTVVLPNNKQGLSKLENQLNQVFASQHQFKRQFLNVALPKFRIESYIDFTKVLGKLGVELAFKEKKADLSGIAGNSGDLFVSKAGQKTFIDVNEEGVEAAAATFVVVAVPESLPLNPPKNFLADHPFIFYIKVNDLIIFAGRVTDPSRT